VAPARILCLNRGSSSLKFAVFEMGDGERRLASGSVADLDAVFDEIERSAPGALSAVGHRIVHGGTAHERPERVDDRLIDELRALVPFAPLHLPGELELVEAVRSRLPDAPQVVCFDTAFHRGMPLAAQRLPLGGGLWEDGVRRYGFHGLSYESAVDTIGAATLGRAVLAHLGNGSSLAAVRDGASMDTTMGFTPTGGCMMGTRSGDLDPGVLLHLIERRGYDAAALDRLVNHDAGLAGVSGRTADMRVLLAERGRDPRAALAVEMFCGSVRKHVGALAAVLGGLDSLVFTGGIGEHAPAVRAEICAGLEHLGVALDAGRNEASAPVVSRGGERCVVRVVAADEERMIARHAARLTGGARR
jgi:acetate kinase